MAPYKDLQCFPQNSEDRGQGATLKDLSLPMAKLIVSGQSGEHPLPTAGGALDPTCLSIYLTYIEVLANPVLQGEEDPIDCGQGGCGCR